MHIEQEIPLLEEILAEYRDRIPVFDGYKNHCYRMIHCCMALGANGQEDREKLAIAAAFHDLGLFTENTVDYLPPSMELARDYLRETGRQSWTTEIELMIDMHHKLTPYKNQQFPLVEIFRRGDLADFSLGLLKSGVSRQDFREIRAAFPNAGFHWFLVRIATVWTLRHPLNPVPIMKW